MCKSHRQGRLSPPQDLGARSPLLLIPSRC